MQIIWLKMNEISMMTVVKRKRFDIYDYCFDSFLREGRTKDEPNA